MSGHGAKLTRKQEQAVAALLAEGSIRKAATKVKVSDRTLRTWLADPAFASAYREARRQVVEHAVARVQRATGRAVRRLVQLLRCGQPPTEARAAVSILTQAVRGVELGDLAQQLEALKAEVEALKSDGNGNAGPAGDETPPRGGPPPGDDGQPSYQGPAPGPGPDHGPGIDGTGRVAGQPPEIEFSEDAPLL